MISSEWLVAQIRRGRYLPVGEKANKTGELAGLSMIRGGEHRFRLWRVAKLTVACVTLASQAQFNGKPLHELQLRSSLSSFWSHPGK